MFIFRSKNPRVVILALPLLVVSWICFAFFVEKLQHSTERPQLKTSTAKAFELTLNNRPKLTQNAQFFKQFKAAKASAKPAVETSTSKQIKKAKTNSQKRLLIAAKEHLHYIRLVHPERPFQWRARFDQAPVKVAAHKIQNWQQYLASYTGQDGQSIEQRLNQLATAESKQQQQQMASLEREQNQMAQFPKLGHLEESVPAVSSTGQQQDQELTQLWDEYSLEKLSLSNSQVRPPDKTRPTLAKPSLHLGNKTVVAPPEQTSKRWPQTTEVGPLASEYSDLVTTAQNMAQEQTRPVVPVNTQGVGIHDLNQVSGRVAKTIVREIQKRSAGKVKVPAFNLAMLNQKQTKPPGPSAGSDPYCTYSSGGACAKNPNGERSGVASAINANFAAASAIKQLFGPQLEALEVDIHTGKAGRLYNYKFAPLYNMHEFEASDSNGKVRFAKNINSDMGIVSGVVHAHGKISTRVDVVIDRTLDPSEANYNIPMFESHSFRKFLEECDLNHGGGHLLVQVQDSALEFDIDKNYGDKIFLSENFSVAKKGVRAAYVLYVGIEAGNLLLKYRLDKRRYTSKVIHIVSGEIYFEVGHLLENSIDTFGVLEATVLSKSPRPLSLQASEVVLFSNDQISQGRGLHRHEFTNLLLPIGTRQYIELKHIEGSVFVGKWNHAEIEVPERDYIAHLLDRFDIEDFTNHCLVQINLPERSKLQEIELGAQAGDDFLDRTVFYLEQDGSFNDEASSRAKKIFVSGRSEGVFHMELKYTNEKSDYLQTYCSPDTYLVEQI